MTYRFHIILSFRRGWSPRKFSPREPEARQTDFRSGPFLSKGCVRACVRENHLSAPVLMRLALRDPSQEAIESRLFGKEPRERMTFVRVASDHVQRAIAKIHRFQGASDFVCFRWSIHFYLLYT